MKQLMKQYTQEDNLVWKTLFTRQIKNLENKACDSYLKYINELESELNENKIPNIENLSTKLYKKSGWKIEIVPGLIPVQDFFKLLSEKKFCSSTWLRKMSQLDYLEEPDMFHDIFGHIPLLLDSNFGDFAQKMGQIGLENLNNEKIIIQLQRLYWFSIEFGIIQEKNIRKIYGAGILSSFQETNTVFEANTTIIPFNLEQIIETDFNNMTLQTNYFELQSFEQLYDSFQQYSAKISD